MCMRNHHYSLSYSGILILCDSVLLHYLSQIVSRYIVHKKFIIYFKYLQNNMLISCYLEIS